LLRLDAGARLDADQQTKEGESMTVSGTVGGLLQSKGNTLWSISPDATVYEAIQLMAEKNIGALPVLDQERLVGVISERDYTRKVILKGKASKETAVREILSSPVISITPETTIEECLRLMTNHRIRHLPVVENDKVVGIVSIGDLVNWIITAQSVAIHQLQSYILGQYTS
jgi:predicted transcriptional regulator